MHREPRRWYQHSVIKFVVPAAVLMILVLGLVPLGLGSSKTADTELSSATLGSANAALTYTLPAAAKRSVPGVGKASKSVHHTLPKHPKHRHHRHHPKPPVVTPTPPVTPTATPTTPQPSDTATPPSTTRTST